MDAVLLVFLTGIRHDLRVLARDRQRYRPLFDEELRIVEGDRPFNVLVVELLETFDDVQLIAMLMPGRIKPGPVIQADRASYVPLESPHQVASRSLGWLRVNDAKDTLVLEQDREHRRRLNNLERHDACLNASSGADREALRQRIVCLVNILESLDSVGCEGRLMP